MQDITVIKYLFEAMQNNYIENINILKACKHKIVVEAVVSDEYRVIPAIGMIEANMYVNKGIRAKHVEYIGQDLRVETFNNIEYIISVKSK